MVEQIDVAPRLRKESFPPPEDREIPLSDNALTVLHKRYLLRGPDGEPVETATQMFWRFSRCRIRRGQGKST